MSAAVETPADCPDENAWIGYLEGATETTTAALRAHLDTCEDCRALVAGMVKAQVPAERDPPTGAWLPRGTSLGRYLLLDPIGRGGMGVVYGAFDPKLDRQVALKLLRTLGSSSESRQAARDHLLAEAQAIARLSHPNVITVHDVGTFEDEVFFAMELIRGGTLRAAVTDHPQDWRRIVGLYSAAGEGLAAAHVAGLVHRDFKPDNVLVSEDGAVRVTDFGLAAKQPAGRDADPRAGTPAYMAPEQWRGQSTNARSDQFSFALALHEALYGFRPHRAGIDPELPTKGSPRPARRRIPAEVGRVIARGLNEDPAQRWPSMPALLSALKRAARRFHPGSLVVALVLAAFAIGIGARHLLSQRVLERDLTRAAERLAPQLASVRALSDLQIDTGLRAPALLEAVQEASDMDAALGLASREDADSQLSEAHELLRSADLPELKGEDGLLLVNAWGRVIFNLAQERSFGEAAPTLPLLTRTMESESRVELWSEPTLIRIGVPFLRATHAGELVWVTAKPIVRGRAAIGAALIGRWFGHEQIADLERSVGASVSLRAPDGGWAGRVLESESIPPDGRVHFVRAGSLAAIAVRPETTAPDVPACTAFAWLDVEASRSVGDPPDVVRMLLATAALAALARVAWQAWRYA